jgi:hypothetical protein
MTTPEQHPITPPPWLMLQWSETWHKAQVKHVSHVEFVAIEAARWGADQELEACVEWVGSMFHGYKTWDDELRAARRPKLPSLKERALSEIADAVAEGNMTPERGATIRLALEALPND